MCKFFVTFFLFKKILWTKINKLKQYTQRWILIGILRINFTVTCCLDIVLTTWAQKKLTAGFFVCLLFNYKLYDWLFFSLVNFAWFSILTLFFLLLRAYADNCFIIYFQLNAFLQQQQFSKRTVDYGSSIDELYIIAIKL